jgi:hypothetical protein
MSDELKGFIGDVACTPPPALGAIQLVNNGSQGFASDSNGSYFVAYKSDTLVTDIIGNYSGDGTTWTPALNGTDPPTHFLFIQKDFPTDCAFYPVVGEYQGYFAMAWLESQPTGRLDLKYSDVPQSIMAPPPIPAPGLSTPISNQNTFFVYPRILIVETGEQTENIPLSDITVVDLLGNTFKIDINQAKHRGLELTLPAPAAAFRWTQNFRIKSGIISGTLTSIPTQVNSFSTSPLAGVAMNIYYGHNGMLYRRVTTNDKGQYVIPVQNFEYTFEVQTGDLSINVNQRLI